MADMKTKPTDHDVEAFLESVENKRRKEDSFTLLEMMKEVTGQAPVLWGSIIGFGSYHYKYESGREGDMLIVGFSPRKQNLTLYIMDGFDAYDELLGKLGKHKTGKACLYINKLADVDMDVLKALVAASVEHMEKTNPSPDEK